MLVFNANSSFDFPIPGGIKFTDLDGLQLSPNIGLCLRRIDSDAKYAFVQDSEYPLIWHVVRDHDGTEMSRFYSIHNYPFVLYLQSHLGVNPDSYFEAVLVSENDLVIDFRRELTKQEHIDRFGY